MPVIVGEAVLALLPYVIEGVTTKVRGSLAKFNAQPRETRVAQVRAVLKSRALFVFPGMALAARATSASPQGVAQLVDLIDTNGDDALRAARAVGEVTTTSYRTAQMKARANPLPFAVTHDLAPVRKGPKVSAQSVEWAPSGPGDIEGVLRVNNTLVVAILRGVKGGRVQLRSRWAVGGAVARYNTLVPANVTDPVAWATDKLVRQVMTTQTEHVLDWEPPQRGKVRSRRR